MEDNIIGEEGKRGKIIKHNKNVAFYVFMIMTSHELKNFIKSILYVRTIIN